MQGGISLFSDGPLDGPSGVKTVEALKKAGLPIVVVVRSGRTPPCPRWYWS